MQRKPWIASCWYLTADKSTSSAGTITRFFPILYGKQKQNRTTLLMINRMEKSRDILMCKT